MYKLVLVDDEVEIRNGLSQYFPWSQLGFTVVETFDNGKNAWEYLSTHKVDALLCDVTMPVMNGLELARRLHEHGSAIAIVLLSGYKEFEYVRQALAYEVKSYIVKPTQYDELYNEFSKIKQELDQAANHRSDALTSGNPVSFPEQVIETIRLYVADHYRQATLEQASKLVRMNSDYVSKFFKQHTGENFSDYVLKVRMVKAAELLQNIHYKTFEVSEMVGYNYPKNFTRSFKKYFGVSPREFRNGQGIEGQSP